MSFEIGDLTLLKNTNSDLLYGEFVELKNDLPIMMVEEIQILNRTEFRTEDGVPKSEKNSQNCKCIWYNHKKGEFKEEWINSKYLTKVPSEKNPLVDESKQDLLKDKIGMSVRLANHDIESKKLIKVGIIENSNTTGNYKMIDRYNEFCAPELLIIDVKTNDKEQNNFDKKTGKKIKEVSENLVKCKWYNKANNKYSERYFPYELLIENSKIEDDILEKIQKAIKSKKYLKIPKIGLYQPLHILNNGGKIQLSCYNYLINKNQLFDLDGIDNIEVLDDFAVRKSPIIEETKTGHDVFSIDDLLNTYKKTYSNFTLRFAYENMLGEFGFKSISKASKFDLDGEIEDAEFYLKGQEEEYGDERFYRVSRIKFAWILNYEAK